MDAQIFRYNYNLSYNYDCISKKDFEYVKILWHRFYCLQK